jgi:carboxymethylenebutenolidase
MGTMIEFARPDGGKTKGYLAMADEGAHGVVVIQEWWGLNDQICGVVDRFARAGYNALAPYLYKGRVTASTDEANHLMTGLNFADATHQDLRGAAQHLKTQSGDLAVMGFCMGGALTIAAAVHIPEFDAAVCFYGIPPKEFADPAKVRIPLQGHFANRDDWCTPAAVDEFERAIRMTGITHEIYRYGAAHAFANERSAAYDVAAANQAWDRMEAFLRSHVG